METVVAMVNVCKSDNDSDKSIELPTAGDGVVYWLVIGLVLLVLTQLTQGHCLSHYKVMTQMPSHTNVCFSISVFYNSLLELVLYLPQRELWLVE